MTVDITQKMSGSIMKEIILILVLIPFFFNSRIDINAQTTNLKIHPYLQTVLLDASNNEMIDAYATLKEQYPMNELRQQTSFLPKKEKQKEVVKILREFANEKQEAIRGYLNDAKQNNLVSKIDILWAANTIVFSAVPSVIYNLAEDFDEIAEIRYDPKFDRDVLADPTETTPTIYNVNPSDNPAPQPGLVLINAPAVWAEGDSGQGVLAANHDGGCDWHHPDLIHNIWNNLGEDFDNDGHTLEWDGLSWIFDPGDINNVDDDLNGYVDDFIGWDFANNNNDPNSDYYHGTCTAGVVCGDGTNGTQTGVAPRTKLINCQLYGESSSWLAIQYSVAAGVAIITSSYSWKWWNIPQPNYPMHRQMNDMELAAGVIHTNSTSNDGNNLVNAPIPFNISAPGNSPPSWLHPDQTLIGGLSSMIGVGNVDASTDIIVSTSPYGPSTWENIQFLHPTYPFTIPQEYWDYPYETLPGSMGLLKPDVSAPGHGSVSTTIGGGYQSFGGTSAATPHVCRTAALLLSANPELTPADVCMILQTTAVDKGVTGKDPRYGAGRIDAYAAYLLAISLIPVELVSFSATADEHSVTLNWCTATERNNSGFAIERKTQLDERWQEIGFVYGAGTSTEMKYYNFINEGLSIGSYNYRLKQIDLDGRFEYSNEIAAEVLVPNSFELFQNYPNPFNPGTIIEFCLTEPGFVNLKIFNVLGEEVMTIVNEERAEGIHYVSFDATYFSGGIYFYKLLWTSQNGERNLSSIKKMVLVK